MRMSGLVHQQEQSRVREKALRNAGASLVTATNRESIYAATMQARAPSWATTAASAARRDRGRPDAFQVVAASGGAEGVEGTAVSLSILPQWKRDRLQSHRSYEVRPRRRSSRARSACPPTRRSS